MSKDLITKGDLVIAESKKFVQYPNNLNEKQLQLILMLVAQIKKDDKKFEWVDIPYSALIKLYNNTNIYSKDSERSVVNMVSDLVKKTYHIEDDTDIYEGHYIDKIRYRKNEKIMSIKLSDETVYFFLEFNDGIYTRLGEIRKLHTKTAIQLYRWAVMKSGFKNKIPININDAIELFYGIDRTIKTKDFIRWHLEPAIKKINELTDVYIEYEKIYDRHDKRKISSLLFDITKSDKYKVDYSSEYLLAGEMAYDDYHNEDDNILDPEYAEWYEEHYS